MLCFLKFGGKSYECLVQSISCLSDKNHMERFGFIFTADFRRISRVGLSRYNCINFDGLVVSTLAQAGDRGSILSQPVNLFFPSFYVCCTCKV